MQFDILSSKVSMSRWQDRETAVSIIYDVVPRDRAYLDIGDGYILAASGYLPLRSAERKPVEATVQITSDPAHISHIKSDDPITGYANFSREMDDPFHPRPPHLHIFVVVEPERFSELLTLRISQPAAATLHVTIEDIEFGWEPDGTHQVWQLPEKMKPRDHDRRPISNFGISIETFWSSESALSIAADQRVDAITGDQDHVEQRGIQTDGASSTAVSASTDLLKQVRTLLAVLVVLVLVLIFRGR